MALVWDWNDRLGEVKVQRRMDDEVIHFTLMIYKGNAFAIFVCHYMEKGEKYYNMHGFMCDKEHAKRMLGIDKKYKETFGRNIYDEGCDRYTEFTLDRNRKEARDLAKLLMDAPWREGITLKLVDYVPTENDAAYVRDEE